MPDDPPITQATAPPAPDPAASPSSSTSTNGLTDAHHDWVHEVCGIDPRDYLDSSGGNSNGISNSGMSGVTPDGVGYSAPGTAPYASQDPANLPDGMASGNQGLTTPGDANTTDVQAGGADGTSPAASPSDANGNEGTPAEPGFLDKAKIALQVAGEVTGVSGVIRTVEDNASAAVDTAKKVGGIVADHPVDAAFGLGYGVVQGLAPGGFLAPSPDPKSQAFELGRGVGMMAGGLGALGTAAGEEVIGTGADATGVGAVVGVPLNVLGAVTAASGVTAEVAGAATIANAMSMGGGGGGTTTPAVPDKANDVTNHALDPANGGQPKPGYKGGQSFANDGRGGGQQLPATDNNGNPISYKEWDVNPLVKGQNRGAERVVTGSDGSSYYTDDHYRTFRKVK
jgi:guanyl-specific ribonuclease Sa